MPPITEVRISLADAKQTANHRLLAFASITLADAFVIHDLKVIKGAKGAFVAMPTRPLTTRCHDCGGKNAILANHCNNCGATLARSESPKRDDAEKPKLFADVAHPINPEARA